MVAVSDATCRCRRSEWLGSGKLRGCDEEEVRVVSRKWCVIVSRKRCVVTSRKGQAAWATSG